MKYIKMLLYDKKKLSLTRVLAVIGWLAFLVGSFYLMHQNTTWGNYDTFATMTAGGGTVTSVGNKFLNSKYNTAYGSYEEKKNEGEK